MEKIHACQEILKNIHAMAWKKFNKEFDNETENFLWLENNNR